MDRCHQQGWDELRSKACGMCRRWWLRFGQADIQIMEINRVAFHPDVDMYLPGAGASTAVQLWDNLQRCIAAYADH